MKNFKGRRMVQEDEIKYLQELKEAHSDPSAEWGGGGSSYTAGTGITIESEIISVDSTVAFKSDIPTFTAGEGITIDASGEIAGNIKAGSGIVVDVDLTDEAIVVMIDQADIPYKSDLSVYQLNSNLVTNIDSSSTDTEYPSAKCVYDIVGDVESLLSNI